MAAARSSCCARPRATFIYENSRMFLDLRYAFRQLRKAPGFTATALATTAICLGANLAIFAVINSVLLRPLPFPNADRLVSIYNTYPKAGVENDGCSLTNYYERRGNITAFSSLSIYNNRSEVVGEPGSTEQVEIMRISPEFFATVGVSLAIGRTFTEAEAGVSEQTAAILTDVYWRQRFNADPNILGRDLRVNGIARKIVGAVNLVNLLLIRASGRAKEMAIRQAMGAGRRHVVSQVMMETISLTFAGGVLGVIVGAWGIRLLEILGANRLPLGAHIAFNSWLALLGLLSAVVLGIVIAAPIAWFNLRGHLANALQSESRTGTISRAAQSLRHGFIVAQIALAFVLLAGAALLGLSLKKVMAVSPGFQSDHVLTGEFTLPWQPHPDHRVEIADRLLELIRQQPGVTPPGIITNMPLLGDTGKPAVAPKDYVPPSGQSVQGHYSYGVAGDYFAALGIPLREGRFLTSADSYRAERVCVVDADLARRYWPNGNALGQKIVHANETDDSQLFTIVGVVGAVKQAALTEPHSQGAVYLPFAYRENSYYFVITRTSQRPEAFAETLRKLVPAADP